MKLPEEFNELSEIIDRCDITAPAEKQSMTIDECFESLETLFKAYQKDSEFNYQLTSTNSAFNQLKKKYNLLKEVFNNENSN